MLILPIYLPYNRSKYFLRTIVVSINFNRLRRKYERFCALCEVGCLDVFLYACIGRKLKT